MCHGPHSTHTLLQLDGRVFLVSTVASVTVVVSVDPTFGGLEHRGVRGQDVFASHTAALDYLTNQLYAGMPLQFER